jgi:phage recombination protein Bet
MQETELAVSFNDEHGTEVSLTKDDVVKYISTDESITDKEVVQFLNMCKYLRLNPFLKEIYLIKYKGSPATYVVSYQSFLMRAEENPNFDGYETTLEGKVPGLTATATVYRKDRTHPVKVSVSYAEAVKQDAQGKPLSQWRNMPEWMLRKVALARALKEAFPTAIGNAAVAMNDGGDINSNDKTVIEARKSLPDDANEALYGIPDEKQEAKLEQKPEAKLEQKPELKPEPEAKAVENAEAKPEAKQEAKVVDNAEAKPTERLQETLYGIMTEKNITTLAKVKEILRKVFPDGRWSNIDKKVFETMTDESIQKVIEYLRQ